MLSLLLILVGLAPQDPVKELRSKDVDTRLVAIEALVRSDHEKAEKALLGALGDEDWAVVEAAAEGLARVGGERSVAPLVELSLEAPILRLRCAAAEALVALDAGAAVEALAKAVGGKRGVRACEALGRVAPGSAEDAGRALEKALKSGDAELRRAAAGAFLAFPEGARLDWFTRLAAEEDDLVRCAVLEAVAGHPAGEFLEPLARELARPGMSDVVERRLLRAAAGVARGEQGGRLARLLEELASSPADAVHARRMRLLSVLGRAGPVDPALVDVLAGDLARGLAHPAAEVRAAALLAGAQLGSGSTLATAVTLALEDPSARVRRTALQVLIDQHVPPGGTPRVEPGLSLAPLLGGSVPPVLEVFPLAAELLRTDADPTVRELAAVALGAVVVEGSLEALGEALADPHWGVAACAAVSLGKAADAPAATRLEALLEHEDWRRRGAAVVGLTQLNGPAAVPGVLRALADPEPAVRRTAWTWLRGIAREELPQERDPWERWWADSPERARFVDAEEERRRREKYGYAAKSNEDLFATVFQELDVIVLDSRGDHIQNLLGRLGIDHRMTTAARHAEAALHPGAVYVSNCTGEIEPGDVERLQWFVKTGGYLFGSCWALTHTIEELVPGVVRKVDTSGEVVDTVEAEPVAPESRWLEGVFPPFVRPVYELQGSHLIAVEDPERAEVLIDSPECSARWGEGNLAVWFRDGHGLILDSANHFELQGMENATHLKRAIDRQAWAVDRLGLSLEELRAVREERWWGSNGKASREVPDTSAFRFLTNFVRHKRLYE